jgi:AraC-like DNA-binding protein
MASRIAPLRAQWLLEVADKLNSDRSIRATHTDYPTALPPPNSRLEARILAVLLEQLGMRPVADAQVTEESRPQQQYQAAKTIRDLVERHLSRRYTITELSRTAGLNRTTAEHTFKAVYGLPIHRWIARRRIEQAKTLLSDTELKISAVAAEVGFRSVPAFYASFFRIEQIRPAEYRNRHRYACR